MAPFPIRRAIGSAKSGEMLLEIMPIDLTAVISVIMGISVVLVPVIGLTARFALKPTVEALARVFEGKGRDQTIEMLERRMALLEQQVDAMEGSVLRLKDAASFDAQLRAQGGPEPGRIPPPSDQPRGSAPEGT